MIFIDEYKDIPGYDGLYGVGRNGEIVSFQKNTPRIMKHNISKDGVHTVLLSRNGKTKRYSVAQLVAHAYIPNPCPDKYKYVRTKKDGDPHDMSADNLEWFSPVEKLQQPDVREKAVQGIREAAKNMDVESIKTATRRKICAMDEKGEIVATFRSIRDAQDIINRKNIGQALRTGCRCGRYYWKYE